MTAPKKDCYCTCYDCTVRDAHFCRFNCSHKESVRDFDDGIAKEAWNSALDEALGLFPEPFNPANALMTQEREAENARLKKLRSAIEKLKK